jgi:hypothetical protein
MKSTLLILAFIFSLNAFSQNALESIEEKSVTRVLKTLSADDMKGRSAREPQEIEKAIKFIEREFKAIGLEPLPGLKGYRQEFEKDMIETANLRIMINEQAFPVSQAVLISNEEELFFTSDLSIKYVTKSENLPNAYRQIMQDTTDKIVMVDPAHAEIFKLLQHRYSEGKRILEASSNPGSTVFLLSSDSIKSYSISGKQNITKIKLTNVVGQLKGKTKPEESVIFSAHYDHLGVVQSADGDSIANGADDDASGTTAVIELARYFKKKKNNNRSLIFAAFTAEEIGGFGSQYFSKQLDPDKVMAMFNIEMIGKPSKWGTNAAFITGFERSDFGTILQKNLKGSAFQFHPDPYTEQNLFYRSDNATLARLGVPAHSISTDQIDSDKLYHTVNDEFESLDMKNVVATIRAIALSATSIVDGTDTPTRIDKSQVK